MLLTVQDETLCYHEYKFEYIIYTKADTLLLVTYYMPCFSQLEYNRTSEYNLKDGDTATRDKDRDILMSNISLSWQNWCGTHSQRFQKSAHPDHKNGSRFFGREAGMVKCVGSKMGWWNCGVGRQCTRVLERKKKVTGIRTWNNEKRSCDRPNIGEGSSSFKLFEV